MSAIARNWLHRLVRRAIDAVLALLVSPSLFVLDAALRRVGYQRTSNALGRLVPLRCELGVFRPELDCRTRRLVRGLELSERAMRSGAMCLSRSLALWVWLRARGVDAKVQFGVRLTDSGLLAHAWVEHDGLPLFETIGELDEGFERLERPE